MDESHSWDEWSFFHCEWQNGFSNVSGIMFVNYVRLKSSYISQGHLVWCLCVWIVWVCAYREIKCHIFERFFFVLFSFMNCGQFEVKRDFGWWLKVSFLFLNQFVFLFERHRRHSGYVKQRWNMSKTVGRFRTYVAKNICQLCDAHILTWARNAAVRNCSPWLSDACKLSLHHAKVCHGAPPCTHL